MPIYGPNYDADYNGWLAWRRRHITGTDSARIAGISPHGDATDVYLDKLGLAAEDDDNPLYRRGHALEPVIADEYTRVTGRAVRKQPPREHRHHSEIACSIDRQIIAGDNHGTAMLECKTTCPEVFRDIQLNGLPDEYIIQIQHNLDCWGYDWGAVAILCTDYTFDFLQFDMARHDGLVAELMERDLEFWHNNVMAQVPPASATTPIDSKQIPKVGGELVHVDGRQEFRLVLRKLAQATEILAEAKILYDVARDRTTHAMEKIGADAIEGHGVRVFWRQMAGRRSLNEKALQAAHPDINLDLYRKQGKPYKLFKPRVL